MLAVRPLRCGPARLTVLAAVVAAGLSACGIVTPGRVATRETAPAACIHPAPLPSAGLPTLPSPSLPVTVSPLPQVSISPRPLPSFSTIAPPDPALSPAGRVISPLPAVTIPVQPVLPALTPIPDPCPPSNPPPGGPTPQAIPQAATELHGVWFVDADHGWIAGGDSRGRGLLVITEDGGRTWHVLALPATAPLNKVVFVDRRHGWASQLGSPGLLRTNDGGLTWTPAAGVRGPVGDMTFPDAIHGWIDLIDGSILGSGDGGATWAPLAPAPIQAAGIFFADSTHGWLVGPGNARAMRASGPPASSVYATADGGRSWQPQEVPPVVQLATGIRMANAREGWAVGNGGGGGLVIGTHDGGAHWVVEASVPGAFVNGSMTWRGNRYAWAAFGTQVVATTDGVHWTGHPVNHNILGPSRLSFGDPYHGWIAGSDGYGPGGGYLLYTSDGGLTWTEVPIPRG